MVKYLYIRRHVLCECIKHGHVISVCTRACAAQVYKRIHDKPITESRTAGICQRENDFYVSPHRQLNVPVGFGIKSIIVTVRGCIPAPNCWCCITLRTSPPTL